MIDTFPNQCTLTCAQPHTRGLLQRAHIFAGRHRRIGKETDRHLDDGDDLQALRHRPVEYERTRSSRRGVALATAREELRQEVREIGIRELMRFGLGRRILQKIVREELLSIHTIAEYGRRIIEYKLSRREPAKRPPIRSGSEGDSQLKKIS